jgi:hypothetical protein
MITTKVDYARSPRGIAAREANQYVGLEDRFLFESGTITQYVYITQYGSRERNPPGSENVIIPPTFHNGEPVTAIGTSAFFRLKVDSITIPDSVTSIKGFAFNETNLTSITIPANVNIDRGSGSGNLNAEILSVYNRNNQKAGTYVRDSDGRWEWRYIGENVDAAR